MLVIISTWFPQCCGRINWDWYISYSKSAKVLSILVGRKSPSSRTSSLTSISCRSSSPRWWSWLNPASRTCRDGDRTRVGNRTCAYSKCFDAIGSIVQIARRGKDVVDFIHHIGSAFSPKWEIRHANIGCKCKIVAYQVQWWTKRAVCNRAFWKSELSRDQQKSRNTNL